MHLQPKKFYCPNNARRKMNEKGVWTWPKYLYFNLVLFNPYVNYHQVKTRLGTAGDRNYVLAVERLSIKKRQEKKACQYVTLISIFHGHILFSICAVASFFCLWDHNVIVWDADVNTALPQMLLLLCHHIFCLFPWSAAYYFIPTKLHKRMEKKLWDNTSLLKTCLNFIFHVKFIILILYFSKQNIY